MTQPAHNDGTVGKALNVLDQVAGFDRPVRFSELLSSSAYPKATLYRLLQTLTHQELVAFDSERQTYSLGMRLVRLAHSAWQQASLAPMARKQLDALAGDLGETVHLAQLDHGQVLYVDKRNAVNPVDMFSQAGKVGPAYCTGVGKAMLAFSPPAQQKQVIAQQSFHAFTPNTLTTSEDLRTELEKIRQRGHAFDDEEHEAGIICVALPILSRTGQVVGGVSVTSTTARHTLGTLAALVPRVQSTADAIAAEVQNWRFPEQIPASA